MDKWYGAIGYSEMVETDPGIWEPNVVERNYFGNVITNRWNRQNSGGVNDNINLSNIISIIADPYATQNCSNMIYVEYLGAKWKITNIEVQFPRLLLTVGGVYNGSQS